MAKKPDTFAPLLHSLNEAYQLALATEEASSKPCCSRVEHWNWLLAAEKIASITPEEEEIWKEFLGCRKQLDKWGIRVNPTAWRDPMMNLKQWEAHIPGLENTLWEGGVYTISIIFGDHSAFPKLRFIVPLFHPNVYPSGTWAMNDLESLESTHILERAPGRRGNCSWANGTLQEPLRFAKLLRMVQKGLNRPNICDPAQSEAYTLYKNDFAKYERTIRSQAEKWRPHPITGLEGRLIHGKDSE